MNVQNHRSLTLTELLVSIMLISVVMLGVVSIEYALRRSRRVSTYGGEVSMRVSGTVIHIINTAAKAIGHAANPGIGTFSDASSEIFWVRSDTTGTPADYSDDTWTRITFDRAGTQHIDVCVGGGLTGIGDTDACSGTEYTLMEAQDVTFDLQTDAVNLDYYLEITVTSLYDNNQAMHPTLNPKSSYTARVNPLSHTW